MPRDQFRALARACADMLADYWDRVDTYPVQSPSASGDLLRALPPHAPDTSDLDPAWTNALDDLQRLILPGLSHWQSPMFFGYFPSNISAPAVLGELLAAGLGVQGMLWATSPAATELEMRVLDWLGEAIGLPPPFLFGTAGHAATGGGVIQGTASDAALSVLVAARDRLRRTGASGPYVVYFSDQAHSSILKAAMVAGLAAGPDDHAGARRIATHADGSMDMHALARELARDRGESLAPCLIVATVGTTASLALDDLRALALARDAHAPHAWLHVDAAHAGAAAVCPEHRALLEGVEHADSICFNPHKWLLTNFDCDCLWLRDRRALNLAMSVNPDYLRNPATDAGVVDYRDWHVPLGRRFRALKLWLVMRHYGVEGLRAHVRDGIALADRLALALSRDDRFELHAPRRLNLVCLRLRPRPGEAPADADRRTRDLHDWINASGKAFVSHALLATPTGPRFTIRAAVGAPATRERHVDALASLLSTAAHAGYASS